MMDRMREDQVAAIRARLAQRGEDGYPVGADAGMRQTYGRIPDDALFQTFDGGCARPEVIHGWQWSATFRRWCALVVFAGGQRGFTFPVRRASEQDQNRDVKTG